MKKIIIALISTLILLTALCVFGTATLAEENSDSAVSEISSTLSLPDGENYAFYAQSRMSRSDLSKYDVRILCVVKEDWFMQIKNFVVTCTFTDGTNPVTLKAIGFNTVFKSITAFGKGGTADTYVAEEGTLLLGLTITEVPAAYADLEVNIPSVSVSTDENAKIEITPPRIDYETPIEEMTDLDVMNDGVVYFATKHDDGQIGQWRRSDNPLLTSKATYILSGNYEGFYDLTFTYTDTDGYNVAIVVNGTLFVVPITNAMKTSSWSTADAKKATVTVPMIKGANVITFTAIDWASADLIDFDLKKNNNYTASNTYTKLASDYTSLAGVATTVPALDADGAELGTLVQLANTTGVKTGTATYSLDGVAKGKYLLVMDYLTTQNDREISVWVTNKAPKSIKVARTASDNRLADISRVAMYIDIEEDAQSINFKSTSQVLNLYGYTLIRVSDEVVETPDIDYDNPVLVKDDIKVATDGVIEGATIQDDGQIGHMRSERNAKATYTLYGNYDGYYDLTIKYTDTDGLLITVSVNGTYYSIPIAKDMITSSWDTADAKSVTITVPMLLGENVIEFSAPSGTWSPNLVDFDLTRNENYNTDNAIVKYASDAILNNAQIEPATNAPDPNRNEVVGFIGNGRSATFKFDTATADKYMLVINYVTNDGRKFNISLDGAESVAYSTTNCGTYGDLSALRSIILFYDLSAGSHSFTFGGQGSDWNPNIYSLTLIPLAD